MRNQFIFISFILLVWTMYLPVAYMRRRMRQMSENDLKKTDRFEWEKQVKSNSITKLISRIFIGIIMFGLLGFHYHQIFEAKDYVYATFNLAIGIVFIISGFLGYKNELKKLESLT